MASRIVTELIVEAAKPIAAHIKAGKPIPTILGAVAGAGVGGSLGNLLNESLIAFGALLGALLGAAASASVFPRPASPYGANDPSHRTPGNVRGWWFGVVGEDQFLLSVLLDRAIFRAPVRSTDQGQRLVDRFREGEVPRPEESHMVYLEDFESLEWWPRTTSLELASRLGEIEKTTELLFVDVRQCNEFITALETCFDAPFVRTERPLGMWRALQIPLWTCLGLAALFGAVAGLSAYWIAHPPPKADKLALFLMRTGPVQILLATLVPCIPIVAWLVWRLIRPPIGRRFTLLNPFEARKAVASSAQ